MKKLAVYLALGVCFLLSSYSFAQSRKQDKEIYQISVYHYSNEAQERSLDRYFRDALIPALHRQNIKPVGVFKAIGNDTAVQKAVYVFMRLNTLQRFAEVSRKLNKDKAYLTAAEEFLNAPHNAAAFDRIETILLNAFSLEPRMRLPQLKGPKSERIYELRSYQSPGEKLFRNKLHMFNEGGETAIFKKLNFNAVFYGEVITGSKMPNLMYMTTFENRADRDAHWKSFRDDPDWKKLSAMPEYKNNVSRIDIVFLRPTEYSGF